MMPRRSSALTARDAVSRVVETCSARSERTGLGRIVRSAALPRLAQQFRMHPPDRGQSDMLVHPRRGLLQPVDHHLEQGEADAAMLLGEQRQHAAVEQEGADRLDRDDVGVVGARIRRADRAEKVARTIFVEQHRLAVERIDDGVRPAADDDIERRDPVSAAHDRRPRVKFAALAPQQDVSGKLDRTIEDAAQQAADRFVRRCAALI